MDAAPGRGYDSETGIGGFHESETMEMKKVSAGNLRAVGYDASTRTLQVETTAGTFQYANVSPEIYRRLIGSSSMWSFYRDNIEDELTARRIR